MFKPLFVKVVNTPLGKVWLQSDGELITRSSFDKMDGRGGKLPDLLNEASTQLNAYFKGDLERFDLPFQQLGTRFQKLVWKELVEIPKGKTLTYQRLAKRVGGKAIARTVGQACGRNPLPILVPCHRVLGATGLLTGYIGGIWRKKWLLEHEGAIEKDLFS